MSSLTFNDIVAGNFPVIVTRTITANAGAARAAGTVLGKVTATGFLDVYDDDVNPADGTETATAILMTDVPAGAANVQAPVLVAGLVRRAALTGLDANGEADLALRGIHMDSES